MKNHKFKIFDTIFQFTYLAKMNESTALRDSAEKRDD